MKELDITKIFDEVDNVLKICTQHCIWKTTNILGNSLESIKCIVDKNLLKYLKTSMI